MFDNHCEEQTLSTQKHRKGCDQLWREFEATGSIRSYLSYKQAYRQNLIPDEIPVSTSCGSGMQ